MSAKVSTTNSPASQPLKIDWFISIWLLLAHLLAIPAFFYFSWANVTAFTILYFATGCFGITFGFHRLLTHRSFKTHKWIERFLATCGTLALQGSVLEWVAHHRMHHAGSDTPADPHNARRGFWYSHVGWLLRVNPAVDDEKVLNRFGRDIMADPYMRWLCTPFAQIGIQVAAGLALVAIGGVGMMFWGIFLRVVAVYHVTWFINSACHMFGYKNYEVDDLATNCWWAAFLAFGEGWHNNHHAHGDVARAGRKWWEFDLTYLIIKTLSVFGLVWDIRQPKDAASSPKAAPASATVMMPQLSNNAGK